MPRGIYLLLRPPGPPRPRLALFCLPPELARRGRARGYLGFGTCPGGAAALLKPVVAAAGDRVAVDAKGVTVDGRLLPRSAPLARDSAGRPLEVRWAGPLTLSPGTFLAVSTFTGRSWDGRYWGLSAAGLVFLLGTLVLTPPLYGYLLALGSLPRGALERAPALRVLPLVGVIVASLFLSQRLRRGQRGGWPVRLLLLALGGLAVAVLPRRLPLVSPLVGLEVHRVYARGGGLRLLAPPFLHALAGAALAASVPAVLLRRRRRAPIASVAHGSARWGTEREARKAGLLGRPGEGLHLGYLDPGCRRPLTDASDHHVLCFAPPGMGKTTALVIPTLLELTSSAWVLDPKGELWEATAGWRRHHLGHECLRYAPTDPETPAWNPLLEIPLGPGDVAAAAVLAANLVTGAAGAEVHWTRAARSLFTLLALHVRYASDLDSTLAALRGALSAKDSHDRLFGELATFDHDEEGTRGWRDPSTGEPTHTHPEVALLARKFLATPGRERGSIVSTLSQFLDPWGDPQIARATSKSDVDLGRLLGSEATTVYLEIPFHDLGRLAPLVRLQLAALGRRLTRRAPGRSRRSIRHAPGRSRRLEVVVDELASLGRVPVLEELLAYFRGYGARCFLLCQDLAQLHRLYGRSETISGNCRVHLTTASQSPETRRHASALAGATTARYRRVSRSDGLSRSGARRTRSMVESSRPLITEGEVGTLELDRGLLYKAGSPPFKVHLRPYFRDPELLGRTRVERGGETP
jgi:type IV secretion system protein VirD4